MIRMYDQFRWTNVSARRNGLTMEYEPVQPFFLIALGERAAVRTFLDVGANIGAYSFFATQVPSVTRIVAFEANPDAAAELCANVGLNGLSERIELDQRAVSNAPGTLRFGVVSRFSGANSVVDTSIHERSTFHREVSVEAITLDDLFAGQTDTGPFCMKIDVEGHEAQVIQGAQSLLSKVQAVIQLEGYEQGGNRKLEDLGYFKLTAVGPDHYYSNMDVFREAAAVVEVYERAMAQLVAYNHRNKAVLLKRGDLALQLTGRTAELARRLAKRVIGTRL